MITRFSASGRGCFHALTLVCLLRALTGCPLDDGGIKPPTPTDPCAAIACGDHGHCEQTGSLAACVCQDGHAGATCETCAAGYLEWPAASATCVDDPCAPDPCSATHQVAGSCEQIGATEYSCACTTGYGGANCSSCAAGYHDDGSGACVADLACQSTTCRQHGSCDDSSGVPMCTCDSGYTGDHCAACATGYTEWPASSGTCVDDPCAPDPCMALHQVAGSCQQAGASDFSCACTSGYGGVACQSCAVGYHDDGAGGCVVDVACLGTTCNQHGSCDDTSGVPVCACASGYTGDHCETCQTGYIEWPTSSGTCVDDPCDPDPCINAHEVSGSCAQTNAATVSCSCEPDYFFNAGVCKPQVVGQGTFGEPYQDLVPADADPEVYDDRRFSVLTGLVLDSASVPVAGATISIHGHAGYGTALTGADGRFSIPVNGGGLVKVVYSAAGFLEVHRQANIPWNDIAVVDTVALTAVEDHFTTVTFDGNPNTVIVHRNLSQEHQATLVFSGDNSAYAVDELGVETPLTSITVRATEFETPEAMPEVLPPASAFTYCAELSADEGAHVRFDQPVVTYVKNFLGFDVGEIVPVGYYDRQAGHWVPSRNGMVVKLLDTGSDGVVDALDATGDDVADDLDDDFELADEVMGLSDPLVYVPGDTYWRVEVQHFTPWDHNWPWAPPPDAKPPQVPEPEVDVKKDNDCKKTGGSFVECRSRILHQDIPVLGTGMDLHYASERVPGYQVLIDVPASGPSVSASLQGIVVKASIAGRVFEVSLPAAPDQWVSFGWDRNDYLGNPVVGAQKLHVEIGYKYQVVYTSAGTDWQNAWDAFGAPGLSSTGVRGQSDFISWRNFDQMIAGTAVADKSLGHGWTLSVNHYFRDYSTLHKGDGSQIANTANTITTVAGNGTYGYSGDNGPATQAALTSPSSAAVDSAGNIYIQDGDNHRIRKVDTIGIITTVAGNGVNGYSGDNGLATQAALSWPDAVAVDSNGNLFIADRGNLRIRKVDIAGIITTVAGNGVEDYSGDNGPATQAAFRTPRGLAIDGAGSIYVADMESNRIRKVDTSGIITTVAGGNYGFSGDNGPAIQAALRWPTRVEVDSAGNLYIADAFNNRIRKVDTSGIITTVAGNGVEGYSGDNGPAVQAALSRPWGVRVDSVGNMYIGDTNNHRIRRVDTAGIINTVAGNGEMGYSGDNGPAIQAALKYPAGVAIDSAGNVYIEDGNNRRIRKVSLSSTFLSLTTTLGDIPVADTNGFGYIMSSAGHHKKTIDLATGVALLTFGYDSAGRLVDVTDQFGDATVIARDALGVATSITSPFGAVTNLDINSAGELASVTYPDNGSYNFSYDSGSLMTSKTDPRGGVYSYDYDAIGRVVQVSDPAGGYTDYGHTTALDGTVTSTITTSEGNVTAYQDVSSSTGANSSTITDPNGSITLFVRSADGFGAAKVEPCGTTISSVSGVDPQYKTAYLKELRERTPSGLERVTQHGRTYVDTDADLLPDQITETLTLNGKVSSVVNDTLQSVVTSMSPTGRTAVTHYDPATLLITSSAAPGLQESTSTYNPDGQLSSITTGTRQTSFGYDTAGNLTSIVGPDSQATTFGHDANGRVIQVQLPDGTTVGFQYDPNGNLTALTAPSTVGHEFGFTGADLQSSYLAPLSGSYQYIYDGERRLVRTVTPSGKQIDNVYDHTQLVQVQTPDGSIDMSYQCGSRLSSVTQRAETIAFEYDGSLLTRKTVGGTLNQVVQLSYDNDFRVVDMTYASGVTTHSYDADGLLVSAAGYTIARDAGNGFPLTVTGGSLELSASYDAFGELAGQDCVVNGASVASWTVTRDISGRIEAKSETVSGVTTEYAYAYDQMGRLLAVTLDGGVVEEYQYGADGVRTYELNTRKGVVSGRTSSYSAEGHLEIAGSVSYQYDLDGFMARKTSGADVTQYLYSVRGETLRVNLPDSTVIDYINDPAGRRIAKKVNGVLVEKYLWQGYTRLLAVYDGTDTLVTRFEYVGGRLPVAMERAGATYYLGYDQVGSLRVVADATGNVVKQLDYDTFGHVLGDSNPGFEIPLGFAGGLHDRDTGLVRMGYRDYDPDTGRWTAKDPAFFAGGSIDLYGYVDSDPVNLSDPEGLLKGGFALYKIFGVGLEAAVTSEGMSVCAEAGVGVGGGVSLDPFGGLSKTGVSVETEISAGLASIKTKQKLMDPCSNPEVTVGLGPLSLTADTSGKVTKFGAKEKIGPVSLSVSGDPGGSYDGSTVGASVKSALPAPKLGFQAKAAVKACKQTRFADWF